MVLRLEEAEPPAAVGDVVRVVGQLVDEVVDLVHERRHEGEADRHDEAEREQVGDRRRRAAALQAPPPLEPLDGRVEREREEERDRDPGQHVARDPDHLEHDRDRDDDDQQRQDRPQPEPDEALRDHPRSIAKRSDGLRPTGYASERSRA